MEKKIKLLSVMFLNVPLAGIMCILAQMLAICHGEILGFQMERFWINFMMAYVIACVIGFTIPCVSWGIAFAKRLGAKPDTLLFGILLNIPVNTTYSVILSICMTFFNACILEGAPWIAVVDGFFRDILVIWLICYIVSFICVKPAERLAEIFSRC